MFSLGTYGSCGFRGVLRIFVIDEQASTNALQMLNKYTYIYTACTSATGKVSAPATSLYGIMVNDGQLMKKTRERRSAKH